jgi:hypothetical protein
VNAFAESLETLTISFDPADSGNLQAANGATPVPALGGTHALLLALGLGCFGMRFRFGADRER